MKKDTNQDRTQLLSGCFDSLVDNNIYFNALACFKIESRKGEAIDVFIRLAKKGHAGAQYMLGLCYERGEPYYNIKMNKKKAAELYLKSAEQNNANAQYKIGNFYYHGTGVKQKHDVAFAWLVKSANQNNADAQYRLGDCYIFGNGTTKNHETAYAWYEKSAENGNADGMLSTARNYANLYKAGIKRKNSLEKAVFWYEKYLSVTKSALPMIKQEYTAFKSKLKELTTKKTDNSEVNRKETADID